MTAAELYATDPGFRGFVRCWVRRRRCPLPLVDYLLDRGMESQAACARWCAEQPERRALRNGYPTDKASPPYPMLLGPGTNKWGWFARTILLDADDIPWNHVPDRFDGLFCPTAAAAFVALLDAWIP